MASGVTAAVQTARVPAARVRPVQDLMIDPQLAAVRLWRTIDRAVIGRYASGATPYYLDGVQLCDARAAPLHGEQLGELEGAR